MSPRRRRRGSREDRTRAVLFLVPNLITTAALMLGFWSITLSIRGEYEISALAIFLAAICDMLDGRVARATRSTSPFGVEYDSLADLVAFGVAPAVLMYNWTLLPLGPRGWLIAGLFALCAALRLARFNVRAQAQSTVVYEGLATTFAGGYIAVVVWFVGWLGVTPPFEPALGISLTAGFVALSLLMVSPIPYPSLKMIRIEGRRAYPTLVAIVVFAVAILLNHEPMLFALGLVYIASGPVYAVLLRRGTLANPDAPVAEEGGGRVQ